MVPFMIAFLIFVPLTSQTSSKAAPKDGEFSMTPGSGSFYAVRHNKPGQKPEMEVIGSAIAMQRANNQARKGGYTLDIKGPFPGNRDALAFIRKHWDAHFAHPKGYEHAQEASQESQKKQEPQKEREPSKE